MLGRGLSKKEEDPSPHLSPQGRGEELDEHGHLACLCRDDNLGSVFL